MSSSKLLFPDGDLVQELQPLSFTEVPIKIEARTNGSFPVTLTVLTPTGDELAPPVTLSASVNALSGFGNLVTGVPAGGAHLVGSPRASEPTEPGDRRRGAPPGAQRQGERQRDGRRRHP